MKKSGSKTESAKQGKGCLALFFAVFLLAGLGFFIPFFLWPMIQMLGAGDWVATPCHIISSRVESHSGSDSTTYSIDIRYRYHFEGSEYESDRYSFVGGSSSGHRGKQEVVRQYPAGSENICYVNPDNPDDAVLEPGFVSDLFYGLIPLIFVAVGGGGIYFALRKTPEGSGSKTRNAGSVPCSPAEVPWEVPAGSVTLRPDTTRWGRVIGLFIFALFWNGMVFGFLVREVVQSYQKDDPEYFLTLFAVPFVLVGIGVLLGFFHSLLAVFNPKPILTIDPSPVHLGDSFSLKWQLLGNVHRLSNMQIVIEAEEHATYRRGTSSYTDTEVFFTETIIDETSHAQMRSGSTDITIPFESMHSFESDNNKIVWGIKLRGDIKWWPDIDESFPITIKPITPQGGRS